MARSWTLSEIAALVAVGGGLLAVAVPSFARNLSFSKMSEPIDGLDRLCKSAVSYAHGRPHELSFPPAAPLTPAEVPRGTAAADPPGAWEHLSWRALDFRFDAPHAFAFKFESGLDPATGAMRFVATAHGDLDGDGVLSTFEARGERAPGEGARVAPGIFIDRAVE
jgi:hypothetical protein